MLDQFGPADIDVFYTKSKLGPRSKAKMLERLRGFFRFAVHREWIPKSPVSPDLRPPAGSSRAANKMPFTDEQVDDIIKACDQFEDRPWANRFGSGVWTCEDMKEFVWMLVYTGLRISDVVLFDMERLHGNEVFLRAKKNGGDGFTYIPDWLRDRLLARAKRYGRKPFLISKAKNLDSIIETWREQLNKVFAMADVGEERATPHRFRHTFARILLQNGVPVADVAEVIGDDEKTVREHYARWVPERQARLTSTRKPPRRPGVDRRQQCRRFAAAIVLSSFSNDPLLQDGMGPSCTCPSVAMRTRSCLQSPACGLQTSSVARSVLPVQSACGPLHLWPFELH